MFEIIRGVKAFSLGNAAVFVIGQWRLPMDKRDCQVAMESARRCSELGHSKYDVALRYLFFRFVQGCATTDSHKMSIESNIAVQNFQLCKSKGVLSQSTIDLYES
jgi:hypothetical protein